MTYTRTLSCISVLALALGFWFAITLPASAQTTLQVRPAQSAANDSATDKALTQAEKERALEQERRQVRDPEARAGDEPVRSFIDEARERIQTNVDSVRHEAVDVRERAENTAREVGDAPRSFLDKARDVLLQKRDEARERVQDAQTQVTERLEDRVANYLNNIKRKMDAATLRLETLAGRIESRIEKLEARGLDMTEARRLLGEARSAIAQAIENIETAFAEAREALAGDLSRNTFGGVASELAQAKEHLREAHQALVNVVRVMKASVDIETDTTSDTDTQ